MKRVRPLLEDMVNYARRAVDIAGQAGEGNLAHDEVRNLAVQRCLEIIGEAANAVPLEVQARVPGHRLPASHRDASPDHPWL